MHGIRFDANNQVKPFVFNGCLIYSESDDNMDNETKTTGADRSRININESYEVDYWSNKFGVSKDKLKAAVQIVGDSGDAVEEFLKK